MKCDLHLNLDAETMGPEVVLVFLVSFLKMAVADSCDNCTKETVMIKPHTNIKYFVLPTSDDPVMAWMDIQKGVYPNTSTIASKLEVGEPITLFIYMKDASKLFDITVTDCWAYDNEDVEKSKYRLHLNEEHLRRKHKVIDKWYKVENPKGSSLKSFMYTDMNSFKFPDKDQVYLKCDIQLCFKSCDKQKIT